MDRANSGTLTVEVSTRKKPLGHTKDGGERERERGGEEREKNREKKKRDEADLEKARVKSRVGR